MSAASRPTVVYVIMLGCSVVGLWVILTLGRNLKPPPNLSGQWKLTPAGNASAKVGTTMQVEQSGRFFQIAFENTASVGMRLTETRTTSHVALRGNGVTMEFNELNTPEAAQLVVDAKDEGRRGTWMISRINQPAVALRGGH
jgi:hypothetical protein